MILIYPKRVVPQFVTRSNTLSQVLPVSNNSTIFTFNSVSSPFFGPRLNCPGEDDCMSEIEGFEPGNRDYVLSYSITVLSKVECTLISSSVSRTNGKINVFVCIFHLSFARPTNFDSCVD